MEGRVAFVREVLREFGERTGALSPSAPQRRYLWTDAFAVCTWITLHRATGDHAHLRAALSLVERVHATLGRHRGDDSRRGWISGLDEAEGLEHPTWAGLRIGKPKPERSAAEPFDERLEWERDGQYFHYLTQWMRALLAVCHAGADGRYLPWAIELARAAHAGFVHGSGERRRMVWKASIDLTRPLVPSMGAHDALDGLLSLRALRDEALRNGWSRADVALDEAIADLRALCAPRDWPTSDPLSVGALLRDACDLARLSAADDTDVAWLPVLVEFATDGVLDLARSGLLRQPAAERLAFRELGLSIGLHAAALLARRFEASVPDATVARRLRDALEALRPWLPLSLTIESFWSQPASQAAASWREHLDINAVMLATSRMPAAYLDP
jgi:hypothetical protein